MQTLVIAALVAIPLAVTGALDVAHGGFIYPFINETLLMITIGLRPRFWRALPLGSAFVGALVAVKRINDVPLTDALPPGTFVCLLFCLVLSYLLEYEARHDFLIRAIMYREHVRADEVCGLLESEIVKRRQIEDELRHLATTDPLSAAFNRRHFVKLATASVARAHRYRSPLSVVMLDIDHFKHINDRYGHTAGDHVIKSFAELCRPCARSIRLGAWAAKSSPSSCQTPTDRARWRSPSGSARFAPTP